MGRRHPDRVDAVAEIGWPLYEYFSLVASPQAWKPIRRSIRLRERLVMSLTTQIGLERNVFDLSPDNARQVLLNSPILSQRKLRQILALPHIRARTIS